MIEEMMMKILGTTISYESMSSNVVEIRSPELNSLLQTLLKTSEIWKMTSTSLLPVSSTEAYNPPNLQTDNSTAIDEKDVTMKNESSVLVKLITDVVIVGTVGFPILIFHLCGKPYKRGFFCDDDSIRYPYKDSTVSTDALYSVGILLPVFSMFCNEFYEDLRRKRMHQELKPVVLYGWSIPPYAFCFYRKIGIFLFGACLSQLTTDIAKYSIGRLRPHFIDVCKPNITCSTVSDPHEYIGPSDFTCTDPDVDRIREARLSFPSGHSSFSAYTMVYLTLYLRGCMHANPTKLLKPFLQFLFIMMTWYTALSRISDNKHHWSDVMIGFLQGAFVAIIVALYVSDIFEKQQKDDDDDKTSRSTVGVTAIPNYNTIDLEQH